VRTLRLIQSPDAGGQWVEIALEVPGRARRTAAARVPSGPSAEDRELIRWYLEDYPQGPADAVTQMTAGRAAGLLAGLGEQLFGAVFDADGDTRAVWEAVRPELADTRVEIVTDVAGAAAVQWELLRDPGTGQALALRAGALVRAHPQAAQPPQLPAPDAGVLRVLLVISRPRAVDVAFRSVARQLARLQDHGGALRLDMLRPPQFAQLDRVLRATRDAGLPYHVVHFDGHGVWADPAEDGWLRRLVPGAAGWSLVSPQRPGAHGYLLFEDPDRPGGVQLADGPALGTLLADAGVPVLVLNACRSAHATPAAGPGPGGGDLHGRIRAYGSLALEVMDAGVAGVVAMRYDVYVGTAARFTADVYAGLLAGQSLGAAVTAARTRLAAAPPSDPGGLVQDWVVPVAYEAAPLHLVQATAPRGHAVTEPGQPDDALPPPPDAGFVGRDETVLALDRAFGSQPVVLLHGQAGAGKTAVAAEFGRWYQRTGGVAGPVVYTLLGQHATLDVLAGELAAAFAVDLAASGQVWEQLTERQRGDVAGQLLRERPLLWIWDDLGSLPGPAGHPPGVVPDARRDLLAFLRAARDTKAKILLISRTEEQAWLGDLPARILLPPMPGSEAALLVRSIAARNGVSLTGLGPSSPVLTAAGGNPRTITDLAERAFRAGCTTSSELETFLAETAIRQD
jgi:hypothetical protein